MVVEPAVDGPRAQRDARSLVTEIYETIGRGRTDSLYSLLGEPVVVFGPRRTDATAKRADALVSLGKVVDPKAKKHAQLRSSGLEVVASPGGHSAWAFDVVTIDGQQLAVTAVLSNTADLWAVTAAAIAAMPSARVAKAESSKDAIVPPGGVAAGRPDARTDAAVERFRKGLTDPQLWGDDLGSRTDALVAGPVAGQIAHGKQAIQRLWKARVAAHTREATSGEITAEMTADGQLVWLSVPVTRVADDEAPMPLRIFAVYEKAGAGWRMIALHEALAIDEPGSGAPFKKILPPAPPAEPEPAKAEPAKAEPAKAEPAAQKADDPAPRKKSKKTKRKPRPDPPAAP